VKLHEKNDKSEGKVYPHHLQNPFSANFLSPVAYM